MCTRHKATERRAHAQEGKPDGNSTGEGQFQYFSDSAFNSVLCGSVVYEKHTKINARSTSLMHCHRNPRTGPARNAPFSVRAHEHGRRSAGERGTTPGATRPGRPAPESSGRGSASDTIPKRRPHGHGSAPTAGADTSDSLRHRKTRAAARCRAALYQRHEFLTSGSSRAKAGIVRKRVNSRGGKAEPGILTGDTSRRDPGTPRGVREFNRRGPAAVPQHILRQSQ